MLSSIGKIGFILLLAVFSAVATGADPPDVIVCDEFRGYGIWTIESDGSNLAEICPTGAYAEYSRGGEKIAFNEYFRKGIWVMQADGSSGKKLVDEGSHPSWTSDGSRIVFAKYNDHYWGKLWIMNEDGSGLQQLSNTIGDQPNCSHYGDRIVFESFNNGIWMMNTDGSNVVQITGFGCDPSWSPDDQHIVFVNGDQHGPIYMMEPDGSNLTQLSVSSGHDPSMGPDGRVVFESSGSLIIVEGLTETLLTTGRYSPDWCLGEAGPPYEPGMVFSGVGLIPFSEIEDGYATTEPGYFLEVENAPFGGALQIFGNFDLARSYGVAKYKIQAAKWPDPSTEPADGDFEDQEEAWGNYLWDPNQGKFVYHLISPDQENKYDIPPESEFWYLDNLLLDWDSTRFTDGKYSLRLKAYKANGWEMSVPESINRLVLVVDNTPPVASIENIYFGGEPVDTCAIVTLDQSDVLEFEITALDEAGHLYRYTLNGSWGDNSGFSITNETYDSGIHGDFWEGVSGYSVYYGGWPATCAYSFNLGVHDRATNGYGRIHHSSYHKNITLILE